MAGVSAAAELAGHARVLLIETESQPGYHATGRSAAILAQTYGSGPVRDLTAASAKFFDTPPDGFVDAPLLSPTLPTAQLCNSFCTSRWPPSDA